MLLRIGNMRGVDLSIFDYDYDLQWFAMMLTPDGDVLGRFGGRDADTPAKYQTLSGLRHSLEGALERFKTEPPRKRSPRMPLYAEDYADAEKLPSQACIHCHHVHEFRRAAMQRQGRWSLEEAWIYPQPENIGLTLDLDRGDRIVSVQPKSAAAKAGLRTKDVLRRVNGQPIASIADLQYALDKAKGNELKFGWHDGTDEKSVTVALPANWRVNDVSWRWSLKSLSPNPSIIGDDLDKDDRKKLGLELRQLAYRQMNFLTPAARHAGLRANDVIVGIDDQALSMTARQFETHIRLHYAVGDEITLNVLRGVERVKVRLKLPE